MIIGDRLPPCAEVHLRSGLLPSRPQSREAAVRAPPGREYLASSVVL